MIPGPCPACGAPAAAPVERWRDRVGAKDYEVFLCASCGVFFSEPRQAVGADWYEKAAPLRAASARPPDASADWRFEEFFSEPLAPGKLLDVGCGDGGFLVLAAERGWTGVGFDYEARMVELAKSRGVDAHTAEFSGFCRARAPGEFDLVSLFDVLEHDPEPARLLGLVSPLLKPGGHVVITLPNAERPLPFGREEHDYPPHHFTRWTAAAMRGFLERNGFEVVRQQAGRLRPSYLADHVYFDVLMPLALSLAKRFLFGAGSGASVTDLYARGTAPPGSVKAVLSDKGRRQRLVDMFKRACVPVTYAVALPLWLWYRLTRPRPGDGLYTLARKKAA